MMESHADRRGLKGEVSGYEHFTIIVIKGKGTYQMRWARSTMMNGKGHWGPPAQLTEGCLPMTATS